MIWVVIIGMTITNFLLRFAPIAILSRLQLPRPVERWLAYVPVSVMASITASEVLHPQGAWPLPWHNPYLAAALPTALIYVFTRSLLGATLTGMVAFLAFRYLLG